MCSAVGLCLWPVSAGFGCINSALSQGQVLKAAPGAETPQQNRFLWEQEPNRTRMLNTLINIIIILSSVYSSRQLQLINQFLRDVSQQTPQDPALLQRCRSSGLAFQRCWSDERGQYSPQGVNSNTYLGPKSWTGDIRHRSTGKTLKSVSRQIYQHFLSALSGSTSGVTDFGSEYWELSGARAQVGKVLTFK